MASLCSPHLTNHLRHLPPKPAHRPIKAFFPSLSFYIFSFISSLSCSPSSHTQHTTSQISYQTTMLLDTLALQVQRTTHRLSSAFPPFVSHFALSNMSEAGMQRCLVSRNSCGGGQRAEIPLPAPSSEPIRSDPTQKTHTSTGVEGTMLPAHECVM